MQYYTATFHMTTIIFLLGSLVVQGRGVTEVSPRRSPVSWRPPVPGGGCPVGARARRPPASSPRGAASCGPPVVVLRGGVVTCHRSGLR